ncbi:MAG: DUF1294 domain-containing protein [Sphingomonas sp.]|uniref:DUF1294 domain-containing protein n=1 Tax=unclassified Sphingomonas TaxID=196159 RepID=UPI002456316B|nr:MULTISPECIES: DUF1294 domain-containing protein [unclassified Sphingomonas]MBQ1497440.1 DUF1294 domain-containing protein [Sphingomonas sp.]MDH4745235.1 DUF1294 domain-containing protein [Sphingomonas sp. CBMAI 2297]
MLALLLAWIVAVNLWTMLRFRQDKRRAAAGMRRVPEAQLLRLALLGGTPGAFAARRLFRHKTRKQPFSTRLLLIAAAQLAAAIALVVLWLRQ